MNPATAPFRVLIVDDEVPARATAARLLATDPRFVLVGEAASGLEALRRIDGLAPDLVVLDVQMPGISGFDVLDAIGPERSFEVIFSTAHQEHALAAFEAHAVDYLLKPYDGRRFARALDKAWAQLSAPRSSDDRTTEHWPRSDRIALRTASGWVSIDVAEITRLVAADKHVEVFVAGAAGPLVVRESLGRMLARLEPSRFCRVHRSEAVCTDAVKSVEPLSHGDAVLVLHDGSSVVLSRTHRRAFLQLWVPPSKYVG